MWLPPRWLEPPGLVRPRLRAPDASMAPRGLHFRAWSMTDVPGLVAAWRDPAMRRWLPEESYPFDVDEARRYVERTVRETAEGTVLPIVIAEQATGKLVASVTFTVWAPRHWNIGYWVVPEHRGRGLATDLVTTLSRWAFDSHPELERLSLYTLPGHTASQRVAGRAGFQLEGTLRHWAEVKGRLYDWVMYSLTRADLA